MGHQGDPALYQRDTGFEMLGIRGRNSLVHPGASAAVSIGRRHIPTVGRWTVAWPVVRRDASWPENGRKDQVTR